MYVKYGTWTDVGSEKLWVLNFGCVRNVGIKELDRAIEVELGETVEEDLQGR
jgi:hypothetical protein